MCVPVCVSVFVCLFNIALFPRSIMLMVCGCLCVCIQNSMIFTDSIILFTKDYNYVALDRIIFT